MEELLAERGFLVDHVTVWRWVQRYVPEMERRLRSRLKPTSDSWRVDSELHPVMGKWGYLYRAVNSSGATIDFLHSAKQDAAAAKRFLSETLGLQHRPVPRVINTDGHSAYSPAIVRLKAEGALDKDCRHRPVPYLNNVLEQDHRAIKRRSMRVSISDRFGGAWRTIAGYEAVHLIRQSPGVLECGVREGRSALSLYCWYVWNGSLIHWSYLTISPSISKLQHCRCDLFSYEI
jgi:transposase, IS6 family